MMTKTKMRIATSGGVLYWYDRASETEVFRFDTNTVAASLRQAVFEYGCKQVIGDKTAGKDNPAAMRKARAAALQDGTWGTRSAQFPDEDIFEAAVALGLFTNSTANREMWKATKPAERAAIGRKEAVADWLADNAPATAVDADAALARFQTA